MPACQLCGTKCRVERFDRLLLEGDIFYEYYCPECSNTKDGTFERHQLSWQTVIHLVLYHLQRSVMSPTSHGIQPASSVPMFFRWKEDICGFIEKHWDDLIPQKNPGVSWQNSVSSVLSAHHEVFLNGLEVKGETGWWALRACEPPRPKQASIGTKDIKRKRSNSMDDELEIKSEAGSIDLMLDEEPPETLPGPSASPSMEDKPMGSSEQIKRQLLSRLLSEDSSILQAALHKVKEEQQQRIPEVTLPKNRIFSVRAPPVENELLRILSRIKNPDFKMKRLRRKLLARRERRRAGIDLFDIDIFMYNYLKDPKPFNADGKRVEMTASKQSVPENLAIKTPYESNKYLSMKFKVLGISSCCKYPFEITSPFSGRPLPEYILRDRDTFSQTPKGQVLMSLKKLFGLVDSCSIDYLHLRKEYVLQLNRLLSTFFWPGIDVSEAVDFPDYSIIAVYNTWLIVGAALIDPDGYVSHFFVHPDFSVSGIGSKLLQLLLRSAPPRDVTLHVSATNPAMLVYNRFGFKPEQYIVNHYDKFYRLAEQSEQCRALSALLPYSKNAFLMRLRR